MHRAVGLRHAGLVDLGALFGEEPIIGRLVERRQLGGTEVVHGAADDVLALEPGGLLEGPVDALVAALAVLVEDRARDGVHQGTQEVRDLRHLGLLALGDVDQGAEQHVLDDAGAQDDLADPAVLAGDLVLPRGCRALTAGRQGERLGPVGERRRPAGFIGMGEPQPVHQRRDLGRGVAEGPPERLVAEEDAGVGTL